MTVAYINLPEKSDVKPELAIAFKLASKKGLSVQCSGIRRFDLTKMSIEQVVQEIGETGFKWREPKFGKMKTALSIGLNLPVATLIFVLDESLDAEFSNSLPALFAADVHNANKLCNLKIWNEGAGQHGGAIIASMTTLLSDGTDAAEFAIGLDNVGITHPDKQPYRTPFIIDPQVRHPEGPIGIIGGDDSP